MCVRVCACVRVCVCACVRVCVCACVRVCEYFALVPSEQGVSRHLSLETFLTFLGGRQISTMLRNIHNLDGLAHFRTIMVFTLHLVASINPDSDST